MRLCVYVISVYVYILVFQWVVGEIYRHMFTWQATDFKNKKHETKEQTQ